MLGFGIRRAEEIRALVPYADGLVVASELIRQLRATPEPAWRRSIEGWVSEWKAACSVQSPLPFRRF